MDLGLHGKAALLVGAGRGIGGAAALALAREGCSIAVVARTAEAVQQRAQQCRAAGAPRAVGIAADATVPAQLDAAVARAVAELGGLDILVTLVGGSQKGGTADTDDAAWEAAFARNLWPAVRASRLALPHLIQSAARQTAARAVPALHSARIEPASAAAASAPPWAKLQPTPLASAAAPQHGTGEGAAAIAHFAATDPDHPAAPSPGATPRGSAVIVHVASIWGREGGGALTYNAAKAALISLAHEQAHELAPRGVRVCSVAPGSTLHPGGSWERRLRADPAGTSAFVQREIPFGRFGTADEVGDVIAFLCSPRASWVAGACVVVDGGQSRTF